MMPKERWQGTGDVPAEYDGFRPLKSKSYERLEAIRKKVNPEEIFPKVDKKTIAKVEKKLDAQSAVAKMWLKGYNSKMKQLKKRKKIQLELSIKDAYRLKQMLPKIKSIYLSGAEQDARRHVLNKLKRAGIK
jgi:hypothetical protein